ncbi:MAG: 50S ribosomal protein L11 methyltransferase [Cellvibrionales bacterium]|nr:50S ribosomal protein L11 methyltransferase [Cellvibrionales bacterium]
MAWLELRLGTTAESAPALEAALLATGAQAVTYRDDGDCPLLEPPPGQTPLWPNTAVTALYAAATDRTATWSRLQALHQGPLPAPHWQILPDRIWEREWLRHQRPLKFGNAFWVHNRPVKDALPTLLLDPGLAFGTGDHPTTALCLDWIAAQSWTGRRLLDYGCGSGILGLAAALFGCPQVQFIDIDPQALSATRQNAQRNGLEQCVTGYARAAPIADPPADVLVANILAAPLQELADHFAALLAPGGALCLSGILAAQTAQILSAYAPAFSDLHVEQRDGWARISGYRTLEPAT